MKKKVETKKPKMIYELTYRIFELTGEGHLREPKMGGWDGDEYIFDHYRGYLSIEAAGQAILERSKASSYTYEYIAMPIITARENEN